MLGNGSSEEAPPGVSPQFNGAPMPQDPSLSQINSQNPVPIMQAPNISKKGKKNNLFIASEERFIEQEERKQESANFLAPPANHNLNESPPGHGR